MRTLFLLVYLALSISVNAQIDQYLTEYSIQEERGAVLISWTTSAGFTCEDISIKSGVDSNSLATLYTYPGICGSENKIEKYTHLFRDVIYNQANYFQIDLGSYGISELLEITIIEVDGLNPKVFPNPANSQSTLLFANDNQDKAVITVFNSKGSLCGPTLVTRKNSIQLSAIGLQSPGLYFFTIEIKGVLRRGKFLFL